ncbi:hypothetical protein CBS101457_006748 [Exobasidium rhododendri]|nr:hypothetical protein CBS101457_006748 [Exobasidium rhododendri]
MLPRTILFRQRQQLPHLLQLRNVSSKAPRVGIAKPNPAKDINLSDASSTSSAIIQNSGGISTNSTHQALLRNRKTPNTKAKAKAQASASRALREQLAASAALDKGGVETILIEEAQQRQQIEKDTLLSSDSTTFLPIRRLRDAVAYATAENYNFEKLISSGRLPRGWQLLEDDEVIYVPQWPQSHSSSSSSMTSSTGLLPSSTSSSVSSSSLSSSSSSTSPTSSPSSASQGEAFIFRSGSYVTWGMTNDQSRKFLRMVIQGRALDGLSAEVEGYDEIGDEAMEYLIAEDQITRVVGDVIVIGQAPRMESDEQFDPDLVDEQDMSRSNEDPTSDPSDWSPLLAQLAFSQGLSRSARLSVQEAALSRYLEEVSTLPGRLEVEGKVPLHRKEVIRKMGTLLKLRQRANLDSENFLDDPEMYWENWKVEHHYDSICLALDIESRFKAYNEKLDHGENLLGILRALLTESSTHRMELIIIYLIAFEVCIALISHEYVPSPMRLWHLVNGSGVEEKILPTPESQSTSDDSEQEIISSIRRLLLRDSQRSHSSTSPSASTRLV